MRLGAAHATLADFVGIRSVGVRHVKINCCCYCQLIVQWAANSTALHNTRKPLCRQLSCAKTSCMRLIHYLEHG